MRVALPLVAIALAYTPVAYAQTRQLDAHVHGVGELKMAIEGTAVSMEFEAPGVDIVGFEYKASTSEDKQAVETALAILENPLALFVPPQAAGCSIADAHAELHIENHDDHHDDEEDHDATEDHDEEEVSHTAFEANYTLTCADPAQLSSLELTYFDTFPNSKELHLQFVTDTGALALEATRDAPFFDLRGAK